MGASIHCILSSALPDHLVGLKIEAALARAIHCSHRHHRHRHRHRHRHHQFVPGLDDGDRSQLYLARPKAKSTMGTSASQWMVELQMQ